jgi:hypothetical protein
MNKKAQYFTLDLLLALIPLTLVLGMSANAISGITSQSQEYVSTYSFHRQANDFMDVIVKTPGVPVNWDETLNATVNGAANYDYDNDLVMSNYINARKIFNLNTTHIEEFLGTTNYNLSVYIYTPLLFANFTNFTFPTHGSPVPDDVHEMVAVERPIVVDNLLMISDDYPEGFADIGNEDGKPSSTCFNSTIDLSQDEIDNFVFWLYLNFTCTNPSSCAAPSTEVGFNNNCGDDKCNEMISQNDFPIKNNQNSFYYCPTQNCTTFKDKATCPKPPGTTTEVEYWTNQTPPASYEMYIQVPSEFLVVGTQEIYTKFQGVASGAAGFIATAPEEITRETLSEYFADSDKFKDKKGKIVLRVWR